MASDTLVERMTETINLWYEDEDYDDWWIYQRDYLEARNTIEVQASRIEALEAALRKIANGDGFGGGNAEVDMSKFAQSILEGSGND